MKFTSLLLTLLHICYIISSQPISPWVAPSPSSYSFSRYGEIPVSHYTGIPDISIPLATIKENDVETNVSISYHGSGIKVDEIASWVGLGWNLNAGGCISRTIRGRPEYPDPVTGLMKPQRTDLGFPEPDRPDGSFSDLTLLESARGPSIDVEPDIFICNFNGKCAKFVFDENGQVRFFNHQDWDIKFLPSYPNEPLRAHESKFVITIEDGTKFEFGERDMLYINDVMAPCAWYLTKIESVTGNTINFEYSSFDVQNYAHSKTSTVVGHDYRIYSNIFDYPTREYFVGRKEVFLTKIKTNNSGWIDFKVIASQEKRRKDYTNFGYYPLDEIIIYDKYGSPLKCLKFLTSYFISPDFTYGQFQGIYQYPYTILDHLRYRLRLDAIQEYSGDRQKWNPPYRFNYYTDINPVLYNLPHRLSPTQDHWGYFNRTNNISLISNIDWYVSPSFWMETFYQIQDDINYNNSPFRGITGGANRESDAEAMKACVLNKIYYPTGGFTEFTFEANDYYEHFVSNNLLCGGLRIKNIKNFNDSGIKIKETEYIYKDLNFLTKEISANSSGRLIDHPKNYYLTIGKVEQNGGYYRPDSESDLADDLGNPSFDNLPYLYPDGSYNIIYHVTAMPAVSLGSALNDPIGYQLVIVKEPGNGYTVYEYTGPESFPNLDYPTSDLSNLFQTQYSTMITFPGQYSMRRQTIGINEWPYLHPYENDWKRGQLTTVYHYSNSNVLIRSQLNEYFFENLHNTSGYIVRSLSAGATEFVHGKYMIPSGWTALKKQINYEYDVTGRVENVQEFFYEGTGHKLLSKLKTYNSRGESILKTIRYPKDSPSVINTSGETLSQMVARNIINPVLKEEVSLNGSNFLSGTVNNFKIENNLILPSDNRVARTDGIYETKEKFNQFDTKGNLIEYYKMSDNDNTFFKTSYTWGYNNTLPVIKAENVDNTTLITEIANSLPAGFASLDALLNSILTFPNSNWNTFNQNLRSKPSLLQALITTYTWKPQIGITSQTDPNGISTYYHYDVFGRLEYIRNDDNNILKTFEYHYKQ